MEKNTKRWKDRGWWVSVEIDRKAAGRKDEDRARTLLDAAQERYDLLLENGKTISRGIFTIKTDFQNLAELLELSTRWTGTLVHVSGNRLGMEDVRELFRLLKCAADYAGCRSEIEDRRLAYLGCHLLHIGLLNYSLASLKSGARYWFSYLKPDKGSHLQALLDKDALAKIMKTSKLCPLFPAKTSAIIEMLPSSVSLRPMNDNLYWVPTKYKIRTHWLSRFPPAVPNSEVMYRRWMKNILDEGFRCSASGGSAAVKMADLIEKEILTRYELFDPEIPNHKHQIPNKFQITISNTRRKRLRCA